MGLLGLLTRVWRRGAHKFIGVIYKSMVKGCVTQRKLHHQEGNSNTGEAELLRPSTPTQTLNLTWPFRVHLLVDRTSEFLWNKRSTERKDASSGLWERQSSHITPWKWGKLDIVACDSLPTLQHCYTIWAIPENAASGYHMLPLHRVRPPESYECKLHSCSSSGLLLPLCPLLHGTHSLRNVTRMISTSELYCASIVRDTALMSHCSLPQSPGEDIFSTPSNVEMIVCRFVWSQGLF